MSRFKRENGKIIISSDKYLYLATAIMLGMFGVGVSFFFGFDYNDMSVITYVPLVISIIYVLGTAFGTVGCFKLLTSRIEISKNGITYEDVFSSRIFVWSQIHDWGLSYVGRGTYYLYFADERLEKKGKYSKKLKGKYIATQVKWVELEIIINELIPFCGEYSVVEPFIPQTQW